MSSPLSSVSLPIPGAGLDSLSALPESSPFTLLNLCSLFCPPFCNPPGPPPRVWPGGGRKAGEEHPHGTEINFLPINFQHGRRCHHLPWALRRTGGQPESLAPRQRVTGPSLEPPTPAPLSGPRFPCLSKSLFLICPTSPWGPLRRMEARCGSTHPEGSEHIDAPSAGPPPRLCRSCVSLLAALSSFSPFELIPSPSLSLSFPALKVGMVVTVPTLLECCHRQKR